MRHNNSAEFVGLAALKARHAEQIAEFEGWAGSEAWGSFHTAHYDWWAFPIDRPSSFGFKWTIYETEAQELIRDTGFLARYRKGLELVSLAWGWRLFEAREVEHPRTSQSWAHWPIRLHKMAVSAQLFGEDAAFRSLCAYGRLLIERGENMTFNGRDLSWLFTGKSESVK